MTTRRRIVDLLSELETYRARYRGVVVPSEIERLNLAIGRRQRRVQALRAQVTELLDEMSRLEAEVAGCHKGYEALLVDAIDRIRTEHGETWSPVAVTGFRLWRWEDGALHGARQQWPAPRKHASCRAPGDVPHSDGSCGRLGCGVYAVKDLAVLLSPDLLDGRCRFVAGRVELTGKVVEHELGYRGEHAQVEAAVMVDGAGWATLDEPPALDRMFAEPDGFFEMHRRPVGTDLAEDITTFIINHVRSTPWTSGHNSG